MDFSDLMLFRKYLLIILFDLHQFHIFSFVYFWITALVEQTSKVQQSTKKYYDVYDVLWLMSYEWIILLWNFSMKLLGLPCGCTKHSKGSVGHSSERRGLRSTFWLREMLHNLLCLCEKKTQVFFFHFSFPGLCQHRTGHS